MIHKWKLYRVSVGRPVCHNCKSEKVRIVNYDIWVKGGEKMSILNNIIDEYVIHKSGAAMYVEILAATIRKQLEEGMEVKDIIEGFRKRRISDRQIMQAFKDFVAITKEKRWEVEPEGIKMRMEHYAHGRYSYCNIYIKYAKGVKTRKVVEDRNVIIKFVTNRNGSVVNVGVEEIK